MAHGFTNRVWAETATVGTGDVTVGAAKPAHCTPDDAGTPDGAERTWLLEEGNDFEIFRGVYTAVGTVVERGTVLLSQIAGVTGTTRMNLSGTATIRIVAAAEDMLSIVDPSNAREILGIEKKNYIINGAMMVSQEYTTVTVTNGYPVDQWAYVKAGTSVITCTQAAKVTPSGSPNRIRGTVTTAQAVLDPTHYSVLRQPIEGNVTSDLQLGTAAAKTVTLKFGVSAPAGTYYACLRNSANNRSYFSPFVVSAGEANSDVYRQITIPLDQAGVWLTNNNVGLYVDIVLAAGAAYQNINVDSWIGGTAYSGADQSNFTATLGAVFELFDVGLYQGDTAPDFVVPSFVDETARCQRYYQKSYSYAHSPGTVTNEGFNNFYLDGLPSSTHRIFSRLGFYAPMRAAPSVVAFSPGTGASGKARDGNGGGDTTASVTFIGEKGFLIDITGASSANVNLQWHWVANARLPL